MTKLVAYIAHPVGTDPIRRQANIANARGWLHWLVDVTPWAISAPWIPYCEELEEGAYRERGITDDLAMLERCDLIVLTGGRISEGMAAERDAARRLGLPVVDITSFGFYPPSADDLQSAAALSLRAKHAATAHARRPWFPPIDYEELQNLKAARGLCKAAGAAMDDVCDTITAIIDRAEAIG